LLEPRPSLRISNLQPDHQVAQRFTVRFRLRDHALDRFGVGGVSQSSLDLGGFCFGGALVDLGFQRFGLLLDGGRFLGLLMRSRVDMVLDRVEAADGARRLGVDGP
jgi:hypothetical protein